MSSLALTCLPWFLSAMTILGMILTGNLYRNAWLVGLVNQGFWFIWVIGTGTWGFLPATVAITVVCYRNHLKWKDLP